MIVAIFDTETTGLLQHSLVPLHNQPHIIELGLILWDPDDDRSEVEASWLFNPEVQLEPKITKITGLTNEDLVGKPTFAECANKIASMFAQADVGVAHNVEFDVGMMNNDLTRCAFPKFPWPDLMRCTVREYEPLFGYRPTLSRLYFHVFGHALAQTHRALDDCRALLKILKRDRDNFFGKEFSCSAK